MATQQQGGGQQYKRSWKNLLINKRYQLRFTLFMVGLSTLLMLGLGIWVMQVANEATQVSIAGAIGKCPDTPPLEEVEAPVSPPPDMPAVPGGDTPPMPVDTTVKPDEAAPPVPPADDTKADDEPADDKKAGKTEEPERPRAKVQMEESKIEIVAPPPKVIRVPANYADKIVERWTCEIAEQNKVTELESRRRQILFVLIGTGILLAFGLGIYGIKMTHKVAGPLFKVGLYLAKMRDGRYDKVYNLRKGDQLVNFYEHFKAAHAGVVEMQKDDIAKLKQVIAAAETAGAGDDATIAELREMLARKEKSIE